MNAAPNHSANAFSVLLTLFILSLFALATVSDPLSAPVEAGEASCICKHCVIVFVVAATTANAGLGSLNLNKFVFAASIFCLSLLPGC